MPTPTLTEYALCEIEDVADQLGYDATQTDSHRRSIIRAINSVSRAIPRHAQREFIATEEQTRYTQICAADILRGYVRVGDLSEITDCAILTPDRDTSYALDVEDDLWLLPDTPEPGHPYGFVKVKSTAPTQPTVGWWLSVTGSWGFVEIPDDIIQIATGCAASWILNDVSKQTQLAREAGRRVSVPSLIAPEYLDAVEDYRTYRVA